VSPVALRPRSTTELIDAAVSLLRRNYLELVTTNALVTVPIIVIMLHFNPRIAPFVPGQVGLPSGFGRYFMLLALTGLVLGPVANAATVVIVSDSYLEREVNIGSALARGISRYWAVLGVGILKGILTTIGFICLIVPMFFCFAWFFATTNVVMVEGKGPIDAVRRSFQLTQGSVGRILGTFLLCGLIVLIVRALIGTVLALLIQAVHPNLTTTTVVTNIVGIFIYPFFAVLLTLLYFDLRIRKEGLDLEIMAKELGVAAPTPAPA